MYRISVAFLFLASIPLMSSAAEKAFPQTEVGHFEIKTLPAARLIASQTDRAYFEDGNGLFRPLFRYISSRDIAMTTPVEAEIAPGVMYFYIGSDVNQETLDSTENVTVHELPERLVASHGVRGSYSERNFKEAATALRDWLASNKTYEAAGEPRGIFWNGPFVPGFFKRFEVHIPLRLIEAE
jgi:hypothetical protein